LDQQSRTPDETRACQGAFGSRLVMAPGDVAEERTAERYTKEALDNFGRIDILVSNSGVSVVRAVQAHTPEEWDSVMNTNVKAVYWAARHVIPIMIKQHSGLILMTGSISGEVGIKHKEHAHLRRAHCIK
jgi:NADP-dependent 3-hydroxy acid dehydrogenase YdfG